MTEKRFELKVNQHNQCDIIDLVESEEKNAICIYNDLGNYYFSSAKALCELLNKFYDENKELYEKNQSLNEKNQLLNEKEKDMVNYLKKEYEYTYNQRMKHLDDAVLVTCYEMIEYHIRSMIEHLEGL